MHLSDFGRPSNTDRRINNLILKLRCFENIEIPIFNMLIVKTFCFGFRLKFDILL